MNPVANQNKIETYIKCKKCGDEIYWNTHKKMTPYKCGAIEIDGSKELVRIIGKEEDYLTLNK